MPRISTWKDAERAKKWNQNNPERHNEFNRKWRENHKEQIKQYLERNKEHIKKLHQEYQVKHRDKIRVANKDYQFHLKMDVLKHYSESNPPKCKRCGFTDIRTLQLDHIDGGGRQARQNNSTMRGGTAFYSYLRRNNYPDNLQVLCANCNFIKKFENKEGINEIEFKCHCE